ncbi:MAG TPA: TRAP transporter substrate-binding protein [Rhodopila sp.]|jgi:tripartite ATP-independent transporter DctP family solute receptor|nr:TRAP transporter substrate-binding protein [Rhodopila sp.]
MSTTRRQILAATAVTLASPLVARHALGDAPAYRLKAAMADVSSHPIYGMLNGWADDIRKRTNGAVEIKVYGAGQLGSQANALTAMQTGTIDFVCHTTGFIETIYPSVAVLDLPYILQTSAEAEKVLDGPVGQKLFEQFPAKGIVGLCWGHWGWRPVTHTKKPVPHPEDIAGTKVRVQPGAIYAATYQTLGAPPTAIDVSEIYLALSQGAVDALEVPLISLIASKFYEVAKHVSNVNFVYNAGAIMGSKKTMDKLPPNFQKAVQEASLAVSPGWRTMMAAKTEDAIAFLKTQGCTIGDVDKAAYAKALQPVWTQYKPIVGAELVDAIQKQTGRA